MKILVTGGAGYIGSHTSISLLGQGNEVIILDNLFNANIKVISRLEKIAGKKVTFIKGDIRDKKILSEIFSQNKIDCVIHFAGLKAVGESCRIPLDYYNNNIGGTISLLEVMNEYKCKNIIFSSSATVYGEPEVMPISENTPTGEVTNPYGRTKLHIEGMLKDLYASDREWNIVLLRYFNPIGAHKSGTIGENPNGIPNNLVPYVTQVAIGKLACLKVYGNDYPTPDGTCIRDYIHVCDLATGHVCALQKITSKSGLSIYNLGTGKGYSVLDIVSALSKTVGFQIKYEIAPRRAGDIAQSYADPEKAKREIGFIAANDIDDMCRDSWNWQQKNPNGYDD